MHVPINRRVALKAHESDIRRWVDEGKSDEWIASALGTSPSSIQSFRSRRTIHRRPTRAAKKSFPKAEDYRSYYEGVLEKVGGGGRRSRRPRLAIWFDPAIQDDPAYQQHWREARKVEVHLREGRIFLTSSR
jgi:hypothetical protein